MLRQIENITIHFSKFPFFGKGHIYLQHGKKFYSFWKIKLNRDEYKQYLANTKSIPVLFSLDNNHYWLFDGKFYKDTDNLKPDEVRALLVTRHKLDEQKINRAKTISAMNRYPISSNREIIPEDVKLLVWERDHGKCVKCGSNVELQYDHIIPVSKGGASTPENLQILCGRCNRAKSDSVV